MFEKKIATVTKDHLVSHLSGYLAQANEVDNLRLVMPKKIEISSVIGGVINEKSLPVYAIDCLTKEFSPTPENLYTYNYSGQITGMVGGRSAQAVDDLAKAHKAACELFVVNHNKAVFSSTDADYTILEFMFLNTEFSGAMQTETNPKNPFWICAFQINVNWLVSEDPPMQHG